MLFSSIPFLFYFLPPVLLLYFLTPDRWKNLTLLLSSLVFYGWGEPRFLLFMLASIAQGYAFGRLMERYPRHKRLFLALSAVLSLGLLGYCKYAGFFLRTLGALTGLSLPALQIALPIGISFYTFQVLSYVIDVYRGTVPPQRNLLQLATYVAMFPQLIAGPIVRYADIAPELTRRRHTLADAAAGARRFVVGLGKKVLIANVLYELMSAFLQSTQPSMLFTWLYAVACALQIYFDFSGYSDMAVGLGQIFGFHFPENFRYPFLSGSVTEFWRRWHISLGSWFRDYVYIPLGGSRCSRSRWLLNVFLVWGLTGLWHGAAWNFVLWGLFFAVLLAAEKLWYGHGLEKTRLLKHLYMLPLLAVSFVLFNAADLPAAGQQIAALFGFGGLPAAGVESLYYLRRRIGHRLAGGHPPARQGGAAPSGHLCRQRRAVRCGACGAGTAAGALYGVSGGRLLQSLPVFSVLRRADHERKTHCLADGMPAGGLSADLLPLGVPEARRRLFPE